MRRMAVLVTLIVAAGACSSGADTATSTRSTSPVSVPVTTIQTTAPTTSDPDSTTTSAALAPTTIGPPSQSGDWSLMSGDLLVSSGDGLIVMRVDGTDRSPVYTVLAEPVLRAFSDGENGVVLQTGDPGESFGAIWHIASAGDEPELLADLVESDSIYEDFEPLKLLTVTDIDGERVVLFRRFGTGYVDGTLHEYSLTTRETMAVSPAGEGEVEAESVAWVEDHFVFTLNAEGNAYIGEFDAAGMWNEAPVGEPLIFADEPDMGASARLAPDTSETVVLAYHSMYRCTEEIGLQISRFEVESWQPIDTVHQIDTSAEEDCWIETLETLDDLAAIYFSGGGTLIVDLVTGTTTSLSLGGPTSFVP